MNIKKIGSSLALLLLLVTFACIEEGTDAVSGKGTKRFRIEADEFVIRTFTPGATETKSLITIYRDAISEADMNESVSLTLELNEDSLDAYNADNDESFLIVDPAAYSLSIPPGTVTFAPGESAKTIRITLNTALLDLGLKYALPFVIKDATGGYEIKASNDKAIVQTLPINKYDGTYEVDGTLVDVINSAIDGSCAYPYTAELHTTGAKQVWLYDPGYGDYYQRICFAPDISRYGGCGLQIDFDDNDNVVSVYNMQEDPLPRGRYYVLNPSGENKFDAGTGTLKIKFDMRYFASGVDTYRSTFDLTLKYEGPR